MLHSRWLGDVQQQQITVIQQKNYIDTDKVSSLITSKSLGEPAFWLHLKFSIDSFRLALINMYRSSVFSHQEGVLLMHSCNFSSAAHRSFVGVASLTDWWYPIKHLSILHSGVDVGINGLSDCGISDVVTALGGFGSISLSVWSENIEWIIKHQWRKNVHGLQKPGQG